MIVGLTGMVVRDVRRVERPRVVRGGFMLRVVASGVEAPHAKTKILL